MSQSLVKKEPGQRPSFHQHPIGQKSGGQPAPKLRLETLIRLENELCAPRKEHISTSAVHQRCIKTPFAGGAGTYEGIGRTQLPVFHARDCNPPRRLSNPKLSKLTFFAKFRYRHHTSDPTICSPVRLEDNEACTRSTESNPTPNGLKTRFHGASSPSKTGRQRQRRRVENR